MPTLFVSFLVPTLAELRLYLHLITFAFSFSFLGTQVANWGLNFLRADLGLLTLYVPHALDPGQGWRHSLLAETLILEKEIM